MGDKGNISIEKQESALLSWIQQFAPYGVFTLDQSLRIKTWNSWMESHSGLSSAHVVGRELIEVFPELVERKLTQPLQRALEGETSILSTALHRYLLPFRSQLDYRETGPMRQTARVAPLLFEGQVFGVIVVIEDVTQRESQADNFHSQHRRDEVLSWALVHLLKSDEPRKTIRQLFFKIAENLDFDTFFLYLQESQGSPIKLYTAGGIADELQKDFLEYPLLSEVANRQEPAFFDSIYSRTEPEYTLLKKAKISAAIAIPLKVDNKNLGVLCFASWNRKQIAFEESDLLKTIAQYLATAVDKENTAKELKKFEEANHWMGAIVESSDDAIISKDLDGVIKSCNKGAARLFGYEIEELIGKPIRILIPNDHLAEESDILNRIRNGEKIEHFETVRQRKDGSLLEVSLMISPVIDVSGKVIGASNIARDITERRRAEQKLTESFQREKLAREKAESANRTKDNFLAALSHELRTPLNPALLIASESAANYQLPEEVRLSFETIRKNIELEASLIDDLLDLTRITTGKIVLNKTLLNIHDVLADAVKTIEAEQREKDLTLDIKFGVLFAVVYGDAVRLQQVFWNVLKNAIKFTPAKGRITIETLDDVDQQLLIKITDTGIGMNADEIARVFTAFAQGDHAAGGASHRFGGLGLGLAICQNLVELHSGKIEAFSAGPNQGTTFIVTLPLFKVNKTPKNDDSNPAKPETNESSDNVIVETSVLLVEDHTATRDVMAQLLRRRNYKVFTADSIAAAREIAGENKLDLLISDLGLPDGNGNDLMNELRMRYGLKGIALTGYGMEEDIARGKMVGFVAHLTKPVRIQLLESALLTVKSKANV